MEEYQRVFVQYVLHTPLKASILSKSVFVAVLRRGVWQSINQDFAYASSSVFISTWALKHIYDRHLYDKGAMDDFSLIFASIRSMLEDPDFLYRNIAGKRGNFLLVKKIDGKLCLCAIETPKTADGDIAIVSASMTGIAYLKKFTLLWSREDG